MQSSAGMYHTPFENIDLEQMSKDVDYSVSDGSVILVKNSSFSNSNSSSLNQSQSTSPVSVLHRRTNFNARTRAINLARSESHDPMKCKHPRAVPPLGIGCSTMEQTQRTQREDYLGSLELDEMAEKFPAEQVRTKKISDLLISSPGEKNQNQKQPMETAKKCVHCGAMETPQWREGPMGRKTLCNACGVQYRKGRLFSHYRPLSSPTFDPSLHTNIPRQVQERKMRDKSEVQQNSDVNYEQVQEVTRGENDELLWDFDSRPQQVETEMIVNDEMLQDFNSRGKQIQEDSILQGFDSRHKQIEEMITIENNVMIKDFNSIPRQVQEMRANNNSVKEQIPSPRAHLVQETKTSKRSQRKKILEKAKRICMASDEEADEDYNPRPLRKAKQKSIFRKQSTMQNSKGSDNEVRDEDYIPKAVHKSKQRSDVGKKCLHCGSTKTPQWREGPMGRGTLCNACGVQYRHGRLFPEYRPISSPSFDPLLHSNLPKKVQQMKTSDNTEKVTVSFDSEVQFLEQPSSR